MLLKQLQYYCAVVECRHFTRAAEQLYVSQSALSQQINKLEAEFGLKLLDREQHPVEPTPAGRELYLLAKKLLQDVESMQKQMQKYLPLEKRTIHLGVITGLGNIDLAQILNAFNARYPDINFTIANHISKALCQLLAGRAIDLALLAAPYDIETQPFEILPLSREEFVLIVPKNHRLAGRKTVPLAETRDETYIFPTADNVSHDIFLTECKRAGFTPRILSKCNGPGRRVDLVRGGLGVSLISSSGLKYYGRTGLAALKLEVPFYKQLVLARRREEHTSPIVLAFWNHIRELCEA